MKRLGLLTTLLMVAMSQTSGNAIALAAPDAAGATAVTATATSTKVATTASTVTATSAKSATEENLKSIARETLAFHFGHSSKNFSTIKEFADSFPVPNKYNRQAGIFVTFSRNGHTRACWGSLYPRFANLVQGTVYATEAALQKEYRFEKVRESEWNLLKAQVTVIKALQPISNMSNQDPMRFGLMVQAGSKGAVLLPGEYSDAYTQLVQCKVKAGIDPRKHCQMYRIVADVFN